MVKFNEIDRFSETHDAKLANIAVILYERLACKNDESIDYILDKLREIEEFDGQFDMSMWDRMYDSFPVGKSTVKWDYVLSSQSHRKFLDRLWKLKNGRKRRNHGTT